MALTRQASLLTGAESRYIRSAGKLLSQPALGKLMGIDGQSVARWGKTSKVPRWADKRGSRLPLSISDKCCGLSVQ